MAPDPWSAFLDWLTTVLVPSWGGLIALLPYFVVIGIIGPIITIIALLWVWHLLTHRRGRVRRTEAQAVPAPIATDGSVRFPSNVPYCEEHRLLYPPHVRTCQIDRADLHVACPVDGTVRAADIETCPGCGTRYILGAGAGPTVVTASSGPRDGGAAVA